MATQKKKKVIGIFANTLFQKNPRGALRLYRTLTEYLAQRDEFEIVCLLEPLPGQTETVFYYRDLKEWLGENPFQKQIFASDEKGFAATCRKWIAKARTLYKKLPFDVRDSLGGLVHFVKTMARLLQTFAKKVARSKRRRRDESVTPDSRGIISTHELDAILNFWWFHIPRNPFIEHVSDSGVPVISWFLDAIPMRIPPWQSGMVPVDLFKTLAGQHLHVADRVIAISQSAAMDAHAFFGVPKERLSVVPCGVPKAAEQAITAEDEKTLYQTIGIDPTLPIVLCIGIEEPSKNTLNILRGCLYLSGKEGAPKFQVVLVGESNSASVQSRFGHVLEKLSSRVNVRFTGYLSDAMLKKLLSKTHTLLYASLWEGFGIPPLEAMAHGAYVVTSDVGPMPEVCGKMAFYCDPYDPFSISDALEKTLRVNKTERLEYSRRAKEYVFNNWTWDQATDKLVKVIHEVTDGRHSITSSNHRNEPVRNQAAEKSVTIDT